MKNFDISNYLANILATKEQDSADIVPENDGYSKAMQILEARQRKQFDLTQQSLAKEEALRKQNENSLVTMLGLDNEGFVGGAADVLAHGVSGIAQLASYGLTAAPRAYTSISEATGAMTPEYANRVREGINSFDKMFTKSPKALADTRSVNDFKDAYFADQQSNEALQRIASTGFKNIGLSTASDLGTLVANAIKTVPNEPIGFLKLLAENSPQIALAIASQGASAVANAGYALSYYDNWSTGFQEKYGRQPTEQEKMEASAKASGLFLFEFLGDSALNTLGKAVPKNAGSSISAALFKDTLLGKTAKAAVATTKPAAEFLKAALPESLTEGVQTYLEGDLEFKPATAEDIYFGAGVGGLTAGAIHTPNILLKSSKDIADAAQAVSTAVKSVMPSNKKPDGYDAAVETGDITSLINNPDPLQNKWVDAAEALTKNAEGKSEEDIKSTVAKIDTEIVSKLQSIADNLLMDTDEKASVLEPKIKEMEDYLADNVVSQKFKDRLALYKAKLASPPNPQKQDFAYKARAKLLKQLDEVVGLREGLNAQLTEGEAGVIEAARAIAASDTTEGTNTPTPDVPKLIARAMKIRGNKSQELADALDAVADLGIATPEEMKTLRILSAEIVASNKAKDVKGVSRDVYYGEGAKKGTTPRKGIDFKGVFKYQDAFNEAFAKNNTEAANTEFDGLSTFLKSHQAKLAAYKQITAGTAAVINKQGVWAIKKISDLSKEENVRKFVKNNGGYAWFGTSDTHQGLNDTIAAIEEEISVMTPVLQKMSLQLGKPINTPALKPEVQNYNSEENAINIPTEFTDLFDEQNRPRFGNSQKVKDFKEKHGLGHAGFRALQKSIEDGSPITIEEARKVDGAFKNRKDAELKEAKKLSQEENEAAKQKAKEPQKQRAVLGRFEIPGINGNTSQVIVYQTGNQIEAVATDGVSNNNDLTGLVETGKTLEEALIFVYGDPFADKESAASLITRLPDTSSNNDVKTSKAKQAEEEKPKVFKPVVEDKGTKPASTGEGKTTSVKTAEAVKPKEPEAVKPVELVKPVEEGIAESEIAGSVYSEEITKAINETQNELSPNKTTSTAEAATQGESQGTGNDSTGTGPSINEDSDKFDDEGQAIEEDKRYTSKQEALKALKVKKKAFIDFMNCL